ncbi:MAG: Inner membrane protein YhaI [Pseudomonas delhiensis]|nr:MAG: Inner membrane protein YhaI [Pseudomonas delhiensis]
MDAPRYKIVFDGTLVPDTPLETAKANLARLFKSDIERVQALFSGQVVVLKRDLSDDEADKYLQALHEAGAAARKESDGTSGLSLSLVETEDHPSAETLAAREAGTHIDDARMVCPKCGHEQARSGECSACGIIIDKYLARQAELAANPVAAAPVAASQPAAAPAAATPYATPQSAVSEEVGFGPLKVLSLSGRIGRVRYLGWTAALMFLTLGGYIISGILSALWLPLGILAMVVVVIGSVVLSVPIAVQRLHDVGWSGWMFLLQLVPFANFVLAVMLLFVPGNESTNRFGPPPPPNSGGVKLLAWSWLALPVLLGILAAIAVPAYQSYVERAHMTQSQGLENDAPADQSGYDDSEQDNSSDDADDSAQ